MFHNKNAYNLKIKQYFKNSSHLGLYLTTLLVIFNCSLASARVINVKFRSNPVDVTKNGFENLRKTSSMIFDSWYDQSNNYLILNIKGKNYHYCGFSAYDWKAFKTADSLGRHYLQNIKGRFDCRIYPYPQY